MAIINLLEIMMKAKMKITINFKAVNFVIELLILTELISTKKSVKNSPKNNKKNKNIYNQSINNK